MEIYAGYCVGNTSLLDIWKTRWEAERAILAEVFNDLQLHGDYDGTEIENYDADDLDEDDILEYVSSIIGEVSFNIDEKLEIYCVNSYFNQELFLQCTDMKIIHEMWEKVVLAQGWFDNFVWDIEIKVRNIEEYL